MSPSGGGKLSLEIPDELRDLPRPTLIALGGLVLNLLALVFLLPYVYGQLDDLRRDLGRLRAETTATRAQTLQAKQDYEFVQENQGRYLDALARGLFEPQDRLVAKARLDDLYVRDHLVSLTYEFASQTTQEAGDVQVVTTPLRLAVDSLLDRDVYTFMKDVEHSFPGVLVLREMTIGQRTPVTDQVLAQIRAGTAVPLFSASLVYDWRVARNPQREAGQ